MCFREQIQREADSNRSHRRARFSLLLDAAQKLPPLKRSIGIRGLAEHRERGVVLSRIAAFRLVPLSVQLFIEDTQGGIQEEIAKNKKARTRRAS